MRSRYLQCSFLIILLSWQVAYTQSQKDSGSGWWPETGMESRPWTRWWWMGNAVDSNNVERLLLEYSRNGIGGVEITPIYGVRGEEENYMDFLSGEWVDVLRFTVEKAREAGMGVDMNTGTGWPFGGPQISDEYAAKQMQIRRLGNISQRKLEKFVRQIHNNPREDLLALSAFNSAGERVNLLDMGAGTVPMGKDGRELVAVTQMSTGQQVKRASPGGEGLVLNHFSGESTGHYLDRFTEAFHGNPGIRAFFNDSYELSDASSASELFPAFRTIKGTFYSGSGSIGSFQSAAYFGTITDHTDNASCHIIDGLSNYHNLILIIRWRKVVSNSGSHTNTSFGAAAA